MNHPGLNSILLGDGGSLHFTEAEGNVERQKERTGGRYPGESPPKLEGRRQKELSAEKTGQGGLCCSGDTCNPTLVTSLPDMVSP